MLHRKKCCLREMHDSRNTESKTGVLKNAMPGKMNTGKKHTRKRLAGSASKRVSDILREVMEIWNFKRARICLEDIL